MRKKGARRAAGDRGEACGAAPAGPATEAVPEIDSGAEAVTEIDSGVEGGADAGSGAEAVSEVEASPQPTDLESIAAESAGTAVAAGVPLEQHQRLLAEFDNYRKRTEREQARLSAWVTGDVLGGLLPVLDDFERAEACLGPEQDSFDREGVLIIRNRLAEALKRNGLEEIKASRGDPFDPQIHEAVLTIPSEEIPEGHVAEVLQRGYAHAGRLLRPAKVIVARGPLDDGAVEQGGRGGA